MLEVRKKLLHAALMITMTTLLISTATAWNNVRVNQCAVFVRNEPIKTVVNPAPIVTVEIPRYSGEVVVTLEFIVTNPIGSPVYWEVWSSLNEVVITATSTRGQVGTQVGAVWRYTSGSYEKQMIFSVTGGFDAAEVDALPFTVCVLRYGGNELTPLLNISVDLENGEDDGSASSDLETEAAAAIGQLNVELDGIPEDLGIDTSYYLGEVYRGQVFYERGDFAKAVEIAEEALEDLRTEKEKTGTNLFLEN